MGCCPSSCLAFVAAAPRHTELGHRRGPPPESGAPAAPPQRPGGSKELQPRVATAAPPVPDRASSSSGRPPLDADLLRANLSAHYEANFLCAPTTPRPLPIVVVTGFLGSGKTTLLQRLMAERGNLRVAAVVHDLAELNVDARLLVQSEKSMRRADVARMDGAVVPLSGCACCPKFERLLADIVKASLREGIDQGLLDYVCLETSGSADPRRLIGLLERRFGATARARLDRVVALVDADQFVGCGMLKDIHPEAEPWEASVQRVQLACADVVVLNKVDLLDAAACEAARARLHELCPHARILSCSFGTVALAELLEVTETPSAGNGVISHEAPSSTWMVSTELEPKPRSAAAPGYTSVVAPGSKGLVAAFDNHGVGSSCCVVEWSADRPVWLGRLQGLLAEGLPACSAWLRRGKGTLWVAEDSSARWEWQVSGRLRYSAQRIIEGFGGAAPRSELVLIFSPGFRRADEEKVRLALDELLEPIPRLGADVLMAQKEAMAKVLAAVPVCEVVGPPQELRASDRELEVLRFRLAGRAKFGIPQNIDLTAPPYEVDVDSMNKELAALVNMMQGGLFVGVGEGVDVATGRVCCALLWPLRVQTKDEEAAIQLFEEMLQVVGAEADVLLLRYFAHVTSCRCGQ